MRDLAQMADIAARLDGNLTGCIYSDTTGKDDEDYARLAMQVLGRMGRELDTSLFVQNGPSTAGLGSGGEGYLSFSIATPTGEGVTTPLTFTRQRRSTTAAGGMRVL